ncbi:MAG: AbrB/MazE/SpoVT family DNA-binding domain-containing protein [Ilumatobacteraceae bacterium]
MSDVKDRRRGASRISSKHQVTIPIDAMRAAGLEVGERLVARADGSGRVILERETDLLADYVGALTGTFEPDAVERLRQEWD